MRKPQLSDALTDFNLHQAWSKVYENQGCAGADQQTLEAFAEQLHKNLETLRDEVNYETYHPQPLLRIELEKPGGGTRPLSIPTIRDRVLQTAVTRVIEPLFEAEFEDCSFAYRKGRSVDQAVERIQLRQRQGYQWVVDADIHCFFDSIDHTLLMTMAGKLVTDVGLLRLIEQWLKATVIDGGRRFVLNKGVAQGSPIAPLLSNLYLHHLDEALLEDNLCLIRFADDFLILCKSQDHAEQALELTDSLLGRLRLQLNTRKTRIVHFNQGFRFLGVQFIRSLAFKTEADEPNLLALPMHEADKNINPESGQAPSAMDLPLPGGHSTKPIGDESEAEPLSIMQLAFLQANVNAEDFSAREQPIDNLERLDEQDLPADHEPLLRTLYLLQHGQV